MCITCPLLNYCIFFKKKEVWNVELMSKGRSDLYSSWVYSSFVSSCTPWGHKFISWLYYWQQWHFYCQVNLTLCLFSAVFIGFLLFLPQYNGIQSHVSFKFYRWEKDKLPEKEKNSAAKWKKKSPNVSGTKAENKFMSRLWGLCKKHKVL